MTPSLKPHDEEQRLKLLRQTELLDTPPEAHYDNMTHILAQAFEAPICLVTLVDAERVWFKSKFGMEACEIPRDTSCCAHVVNARQPIVCHDTTTDSRFNDSPCTLEAGFRFYMGHPIIPPGTRHARSAQCCP